MACKLALTVFGLWLVVNGLLIITNQLEAKPIATFTRMASLTNTIVDVSGLRKYADSIYRVMGALYLAVGVGCMHGCNFGICLSFLLSLLSIFTFDNPLFSDTAANDKKFSVLAHILICVTAMSLCSCCSSSSCCPQWCCGKGTTDAPAAAIDEQAKKDANEKQPKDKDKDDNEQGQKKGKHGKHK